jgi:ERCC4-type nuclease
MIVVTPGETALLSALNDAGIEVTVENLHVGDIHIRDGETTLYIFERKAKGDLDASIKDGRYREQKSRLIETGLPRRNIIYIIEQLSKPRDEPAARRVWSAMCNTFHRDLFSVFQTKSIAETVRYLQTMEASVEKFKMDDAKEEPSTDVNINIKKRSVATNDWFMYSLTLIPKCSLSIAGVITGVYPKASALKEVIDERGVKCLADLRHGKSSRRIGDKLSTDICETILSNY